MSETIQVGIITVSDRAAAGEYEDLGGPALRAESAKQGWEVLVEATVPDEIGRIQEALRSFAAQGCGLILTTGGTGIAPRDVTPEAIRGIMRTELPRLRRGDARRFHPPHAERHPFPRARRGGGSFPCGGFARETGRRGRVPRVRGGGHRAWGQVGPTRADIVLIGSGRQEVI